MFHYVQVCPCPQDCEWPRTKPVSRTELKSCVHGVSQARLIFIPVLLVCHQTCLVISGLSLYIFYSHCLKYSPCSSFEFYLRSLFLQEAFLEPPSLGSVFPLWVWLKSRACAELGVMWGCCWKRGLFRYGKDREGSLDSSSKWGLGAWSRYKSQMTEPEQREQGGWAEWLRVKSSWMGIWDRRSYIVI